MAAADAQEAIHVRDTGHLSNRDIADATERWRGFEFGPVECPERELVFL